VATEVVNRQRLAPIDAAMCVRLADATLMSSGKTNARVTIVFVRDRVIRSLNRQYRQVNRATDVLSFPAGEQMPGDGNEQYLGDVVISMDTALRQAESAGHSVEREIGELLIHGLLHLCGYDHEADSGEMNRLELRLRRKLLRGFA
jgi:probable rRNA maturation factor